MNATHQNHWLGGRVGLLIPFLKKMHVLTPNFPYSAPFPSIFASRPPQKKKTAPPPRYWNFP